MTVINTKERTFGPYFVLAMLWLHYVEDDADTIFIVVSHKSLVRVGRVSSDYSIAFEAALSRLVIRNDDPRSWLERERSLC